jgi:hypothetical protein
MNKYQWTIFNKYYFATFEQAVQCAKAILIARMYPTIVDSTFTVKETQHGGSVTLNQPWTLVGNSHLLVVPLRKIKVIGG